MSVAARGSRGCAQRSATRLRASPRCRSASRPGSVPRSRPGPRGARGASCRRARCGRSCRPRRRRCRVGEDDRTVRGLRDAVQRRVAGADLGGQRRSTVTAEPAMTGPGQRGLFCRRRHAPEAVIPAVHGKRSPVAPCADPDRGAASVPSFRSVPVKLREAPEPAIGREQAHLSRGPEGVARCEEHSAARSLRDIPHGTGRRRAIGRRRRVEQEQATRPIAGARGRGQDRHTTAQQCRADHRRPAPHRTPDGRIAGTFTDQATFTPRGPHAPSSPDLPSKRIRASTRPRRNSTMTGLQWLSGASTPATRSFGTATTARVAAPPPVMLLASDGADSTCRRGSVA